jgi:hypothetical protein
MLAQPMQHALGLSRKRHFSLLRSPVPSDYLGSSAVLPAR